MNVELPFLAEGVEGGDVVQLLVHEGDQVTEGQALIELETEKATVPVPAPAAGKVVRLLVRQGDHVKVGQALVELDGADHTAKPAENQKPEGSAVPPISHPPPAVEQQKEPNASPSEVPVDTEQSATMQAPSAPPAAASSSGGSAVPASPSVRRLARELGVDLAQVKGSESGGRITAEDVKLFVRQRSGRGGAPTEKDRTFMTMYGHEHREALPSIRRTIAANMTQAWTTIPHVHQFQDADITDLMTLHKRYAPEFKKKGATLTLTSLVLKAVVHALKQYPQLNASLDLTNGEVIFKDYYNIGVAVDTPAGLIVPVIHHADQKDLLQLSLELADLAERTRKREVKLEELRGSTFTVSNMGGIGAGPFTPIIYPPQVGILGLGRARMMPVYRDGQFVPRRVLQLCVAYDHRLVDGTVGARFTNEIVKVLEDFQAMFLGL
ncbi:MAG: 2-oxo acid dehydrogenase subunit E2 [Nitrospira sp.]